MGIVADGNECNAQRIGGEWLCFGINKVHGNL
jgi:hypothetical protein